MALKKIEPKKLSTLINLEVEGDLIAGHVGAITTGVTQFGEAQFIHFDRVTALILGGQEIDIATENEFSMAISAGLKGYPWGELEGKEFQLTLSGRKVMKKGQSPMKQYELMVEE